MSHILVVDDSRTQAAIYQRVLEHAGHAISLAETADEAFEICLNTTPDLVILDQYLGEDSGLDVCQRLKGDIALQLIPVLFLTGSANEKDHIAALEAGADAFLSKDSPKDELLAVASRLLRTMLPVQAIERDAETRDALLRGARVLVIDDSPTYLHQLCQALTNEGFQVTGELSPEQGVTLLDQQTFDVGVIDIEMPDMDGFEVCRRAREWAGQHQRQLGLLVVTGRENKELPMQSFDAGADDFVSKMQEIDVIVAHVRALVRRVRTMRHINGMNLRAHLHELALREADWQREQAEERAQHADELKRSNEELERFAYVVAHDLKAPLRTISGYCQLLDQSTAGIRDEQANEYISKTLLGTKRMAAIIDDLLQYSRVNKTEDPPVATDFQAAFDQVVANLQAAIDESGATVSCDRLPTLTANESQILQLLQNLIGNAVKFRGERPPEVHVAAEQQDGSWQFSVRDNGIGIDRQYGDRIFEVFKRLHAQGKYEGTGIGLAICRKIVELHGGRIWVESQPGQGSVFCFTITEPSE